MNGKIKTKFAALFAVALMITVCVVPVVGGSEDVEAADLVVPSGTNVLGEITISGSVFFEDGSPMIGAKVTVKGNDAVTTDAYTDSYGAYSAVVVTSGEKDESFALTVEVDCNTKTFNIGENDEYDNPAFKAWASVPSLSITTSTDVSGVDFRAKYVYLQGNILYKNGSGENGLLTVADNADVKLYNKNENGYEVVAGTQNSSTSGSTYSIMVPQGTIAAEGSSLVLAIESNNTKIAEGVVSNCTASQKIDVKSVDTYVFKVNGSAEVAESITFKADSNTKYNLGSGYTGNITAADVNEGAFEIYVPFKITDSSTLNLTATSKYGTLGFVNNYPSTDYITVYDYVQSNKISGTVSMSGIPASEGTVTVNFMKTVPAATEGEQPTTTVVNIATTSSSVVSGKYVIFYENPAEQVVISSVKVLYEDGSETQVTGFKFGTASVADITVDSDGYYKYSGTVTGLNNKGIGGVTINVASASTFDLFGSNVTDSNGKYAFMLQENISISYGPVFTGCTFNITSISKTVNADVTQNFVMNPKKVVFEVTDGVDGNKLEGAKVYYSLDYNSLDQDEKEDATWSSTPLVTGEDGKVELTIDGNATVAWYAAYDGRSFANDVKNPIIYSDSATTSTNDYLLTFEFKAGNTDVDIAGLALPVVMVGKKTVMTGNSSAGDYYDWVQAGTLKLDEENKGAAYIYVPTPESGNSYFLYDADGKVGKYYIANDVSPITLPSSSKKDTFEVTLAENLKTGLVKDKTENPIAGATVTFLDDDDVVIGSGVTNSVGYYEFATTQATVSKVKITNAGVYTFNETYTAANITALEGIYTGVVRDASSAPIYNADITVTSKATVDGQAYTSKADALGIFKFIGLPGASNANASTMLSAVDADGIYTFKPYDDVKTFVGLIANEKTYTIAVAEYGGTPRAAGVSVDIYQENSNEAPSLVKSGLMTDKNGEVKVILDASKTYLALPKSVEFGLQFDDAPVSFANGIVAKNKYVDLELKSANSVGVLIDDAEYVVSSYNVSNAGETKVGEATAVDGKIKIIKGEEYKVSSPEGALYTFGNETDKYYISESSGILEANESVYSGNVTSKTQTGIPAKAIEGVAITLKNDKNEIVGTGVTDKAGKYEIIAIDAETAFAADAELAIGKFTFDEDGVAFEDTGNVNDGHYVANIVAEQFLYSGYYADGAVIEDVKVSYTDVSGAVASANVVDNKYYIASVDEISGNVTATATNFYAAGTLDGNLKVDAQKVPVYNIANSQNRDYVQIYAPSKIVYGTVITLAAQNEYSTGVPGEDGVIQKYKFAGWYVNGDKVSDELIYVYTVEGDCTIYADYKVSSYVAAPADESNGLSMDVLVLGIVIVVLALLAFVYAVKFKKE